MSRSRIRLINSENSRSRENQAEDTSQFIGAELQQAKKTLDGLEARVGQWKLSHNGELPEQENALSASLASLQVKLQGNQEALNRADQSRTLNANNLSLAESSLATLERSADEAKEQAKHVRATPVETAPVEAPVRPKTRREILKEELASLSQRYGDEHPEIRRRKAELAELPPDKEEPPAPKRVVTANPQPANQEVVPASITAAIIAGKERIASLRVQLELSTKEYEAAKQDRVRIVHELEAAQAHIDRLPIREQEMAGLTRDYEMAKEHYKSLLDRKLSASMATDLERSEQGERFTIIDRARVPDQPYKPPRTVFYIVGVISSLLIGAVGILARRLPKDTMLGEWELTPGVVVLGRVPMIAASERGLSALPHGANS